MLQAGAGPAADGPHDGPQPILGVGNQSVCNRSVDQAPLNLAGIELATGNELVKTKRGTVELMIPAALQRTGKRVDFALESSRAIRAKRPVVRLWRPGQFGGGGGFLASATSHAGATASGSSFIHR
jgi:hypothetical protein